MDYKEFKDKILEELRDFFGDRAEMEIIRMQKNNGLQYDGIQINRNEKGHRVTPVIRLDELHKEYGGGDMDMEDCVQAVLRIIKNNEVPESVEQFVERIRDWDFARKNVYPMLLSTEDNRDLLQKLVSMPMLDLSVVYIIRTPMMGSCDGSIRISRSMLDVYGISTEQLHRQAMENLRKDGYEFQDIDSVIQSMLALGYPGGIPVGRIRDVEMHILTNSCRTFGAAGILDRELLRRFAGKQDYFILPSSVHETIFVPVTGRFGKEAFDSMVAEVNQNEVSPEERLASHCYYYHAGTSEIMMCA